MSRISPIARVLATVPSGLETLAVEECKLLPFVQSATHLRRGKIEIRLPADDVNKIKELRSIDNAFVIVGSFENFLEDDADKEVCLKTFHKLAWQLEFKDSIAVWKSFTGYKHNVYVADPFPDRPDVLPLPTAALFARPKSSSAAASSDAPVSNSSTASSDEAANTDTTASPTQSEDTSKNGGEGTTQVAGEPDISSLSLADAASSTEANGSTAAEDTMAASNGSTAAEDTVAASNGSVASQEDVAPLAPTFRATCNRIGMKHTFSSMDIARAFGGSCNDRHHWTVKMVDSDIDVVVNIMERNIEVCIALTTESLHYRNMSFFGPTTLRSTICNGLLRLANIQPGEVVCDPMCGSGSIPIEGAVAFPKGVYLGGDNHEVGCGYSANNITALSEKRMLADKGALPIDTYLWDVGQLPLRTGSVDAFVSDLPFGKRIGSAANNKVLYPRLLLEMARVCRCTTGRAVLMSLDKRTLLRSVSASPFWKTRYSRTLNVGGLPACAYYLTRNSKEVE
eukprot:scpid20302/ scgid5409/ THUMP domain-containing protein 3